MSRQLVAMKPCPPWCTHHFRIFNDEEEAGFHGAHISDLVRIVEGAFVGDVFEKLGITLEPLQDDLVGDADEARELAAELLAAADKLDRINAGEFA